MGTTVTTNLSLIKPDTDESIKAALPTFAGWAAQQASNMDTLDSLFKDDTGTYTPNFTCGGVTVTLGSGGFVEGKFIRLFPRLTVGFFRVFMGTTGFVPGTGSYRITPPTGATHFPVEFTTANDNLPIGRAQLFDNDTIANGTNLLCEFDLVTGGIIFRTAAGPFWTNAVPFTVAQSDRLTGYVLYPTEDP